MIARIINLNVARARVSAATTYTESHKKFLRSCGLLASNPQKWWDYWMPVRWLWYPWHSVLTWWKR